MIQLFNITKAFQRDQNALSDITLRVAKGEFVYLTGPSGAGKSTLLKLICCAERPTRGQILMDGRNITQLPTRHIPHLRRNLGIVFQDFKLLNRRTVFENVAFPLEVQGRRRIEISKKVYQVLKQVGLEHRLSHHPLQLSGGEQQRVAVARALVVDPLVLLADEPTGNLDPDVTMEIMEMFKGANARGTTIVMATHDRGLIRQFPRRVVSLEAGRIAGDSRP
ncbi:MAG: cell division ATP-binding protein FtsE [Deltaproteobacteria bacterium]|nr:MAG: cell division ATP-binding protein FtsE [Deltaproteobacteria bacterium]